MPAPFDVTEYTWRTMQAANAAGFKAVEVAAMEPVPILAYGRPASVGQGGAAPLVYVSAGIHGDEPAGPLALLDLLQEDAFAADIAWQICPLLNPAGMDVGRRENPDGIDLNRDYRDPRSQEVRHHIDWLRHFAFRFDLCICLHEDWEAGGYYIYELNPDRQTSLADAALAEAAPVVGVEEATEIDGLPAAGGLIRPSSDPADLIIEGWPEALYLLQHHTRHSYTFESPSNAPLEARVKAHAAALKRALAAFAATRDGAIEEGEG